jgi:hypothetical protein
MTIEVAAMKPNNEIDNSAAITGLSIAGFAYAKGKANSSNGQGVTSNTAANAVSMTGNSPGLKVTQAFLALFLVSVIAVALPVIGVNSHESWDFLPNIVRWTIGNWLVVLILIVLAVVVMIGAGIAALVSLPVFTGVKMKARVYGINSDEAKQAGKMKTNLFSGLAFAAIIAPLFLTIAYPLFIVQNAFECLRVLKGALTGKPVAFRGDSGRYYDRMRKAYAQWLAMGMSREDADRELRKACEGMFTGQHEKIDETSWNNGYREQLLSQMISRHGPIDAYVGKVSATGNVVTKDSLAGKGKDKDGVSKKYSAI